MCNDLKQAELLVYKRVLTEIKDMSGVLDPVEVLVTCFKSLNLRILELEKELGIDIPDKDLIVDIINRCAKKGR